MKNFFVVFFAIAVLCTCNALAQQWVMLSKTLTHANNPISVYSFDQTVIVWDFDDSLRISTDDGANWFAHSIDLFINGSRTSVDYVWFYSSTVGYAFSGRGGTPYIFKTTDQGANWNLAFQNTASSPRQHNTWEMQFVNNSVGFFLSNNGYYDIYKTSNGGTSFAKLNIPHGEDGLSFISIYSFHFYDENNGYVVGNIYQEPSPGTRYNAAYTTDGGNSWILVTIPWRNGQNSVAEIHAVDISKSNKNQVWAGGYNSKVNGDGGKLNCTSNGFSGSPSWTPYYLPDETESDPGLIQIQSLDESHIWAQDGMNIYYFTNCNSEQKWAFNSVNNISMQSAEEGWAIINREVYHFTKKTPKTITIISPVDNEQWEAGIAQVIKWNANYDLSKVKLFLLKDDSEYMSITDDPIDNIGQYEWDVPNNLEGQFTIKVEDAIDGAVYSISKTFNIFPLKNEQSIHKCNNSDDVGLDVENQTINILQQIDDKFAKYLLDIYEGIYFQFRKNINENNYPPGWNIAGFGSAATCPSINFQIIYKDNNLILDNIQRLQLTCAHEIIHAIINQKYYYMSKCPYGWNEGLADWGPYYIYGLESYLYPSFNNLIYKLQHNDQECIANFKSDDSFDPRLEASNLDYWKKVPPNGHSDEYRAAQFDFWKYYLGTNNDPTKPDLNKFKALVNGKFPTIRDVQNWKKLYLPKAQIKDIAKNKGLQGFDVILVHCPITLMATNTKMEKTGIGNDTTVKFEIIPKSDVLIDSIGGPMALILPPDSFYTYNLFAHDTGSFTLEIWKAIKQGYKYLEYQGYISNILTKGTLKIYKDTLKNDYGLRVDFNNDNQPDTIIYPIKSQTHIFTGALLYEDFENDTLDDRISIITKGNFTDKPDTLRTEHFGSLKAFNFGNTDCPSNCYIPNDGFYEQPNRSQLRITFLVPTYVTSLSFMWSEIDGNWGSVGYVLVDSILVPAENFGINPNSNGMDDETVRHYIYILNKEVSIIDIGVWDITSQSKIYLDNLLVSNDYIYIDDVNNEAIIYSNNNNFYINPNPLNINGTLTYNIPNPSEVSISITSPLGNIERYLLKDSYMFPGVYSQDLNINDLPSGVYFCTLKTSNFIKTKKFIVIR